MLRVSGHRSVWPGSRQLVRRRAQKARLGDGGGEHQLAAEVESLLAGAETHWEHDEHGFDRRMAEIEPLQFYMGTLHSLLGQYEHCHSLEEIYHELCGVLRQERTWFAGQGLWPEEPYMLEDLLAPE